MAEIDKVPSGIFHTDLDRLYRNDRMLDGKHKKGTFDKYELDAVYNDTTLNRKYVRNLSLGHTALTYDNWSHLSAQTGFSIWKFPVSDYEDADENQLFFNDQILDYRGEADSEILTKFDSVFIYTDSDYTDVTIEAGTEGGTVFDLLADADNYIYIRGLEKFSGASFDLKKKASDYSLTYEYSTATGWKTLTVTDDTSNLKRSGMVYWTQPDDWAMGTVNYVTGYYIRIKTATDPAITATAYYILPNDSVIALLSLSSTQIQDEGWAWCYYSDYIYVTIRNTGNSSYEGDYFIASSSSATNKENFFIHNNEYTVDHLKASYVASELNNILTMLVITDGGTDEYGNLLAAYSAGKVRFSENIYDIVAGSDVALDPSTINYVFVEEGIGVATVSANTTGFTTTCIPLAEVTTGPDSILLITDQRTFFVNSKLVNVVAKTANYTITINDDVVTCGAGNETLTVDLPEPLEGKIYYIKNVGTGVITVDANTTGGTTIDGNNTINLNQYETLQVVSDDTEYHII